MVIAAARKLISSARWYVLNMARYALRRRAASGGDRLAVLDIRTNLWHRYLHLLVLFLHRSGFRVVVRHRFSFIGCWASEVLFRSNRGFRLGCFSQSLPADAWLFTDQEARGPHFRLDADYFDLPGAPEQGVRVPMSMGDRLYREAPLPPADEQHERERGIFFFGNMDRQAYDREELGKAFGCFTRSRLLELIEQRMPDRIRRPTSLRDARATAEQPIVLADRNQVFISPEELLPVLRRFDFFLAASGVVMPLCHNAIEAMRAGCIPILQHGHLFDPPLRDGIECLAFTDEEGLLAMIERAIRMTGEEAVRMRSAVERYYREALSEEAVVRRLQAAWPGNVRLRLNAEGRSTMLLLEKLQRAASSE